MDKDFDKLFTKEMILECYERDTKLFETEIAELKAVIDYIDDELTMNEHHYHCNCASKLRNYLATLEQG